MKLLRHIAVCTVSLLLLAVLPFALAGGFSRLSGGTDAVSSASAVIDKPSGSYIVLINRDRHSESDLEAWREFFSGGDFSIIFDDISCVTLDGDAGALTLAQSFMSRLPENQMTVKSREAVITLSKADNGRTDVMIVSDEAAEKYGLSSVYDGKNVEVIRVNDGGAG
ncbi:MAG: hypothetical protein IJT87_00485 [Ruminiclostridium sp.]|nr:hypothetical protein [Ruminiclostridium sp.]